MTKKTNAKGLNVFEKYLTVWVIFCIIGGIVLGKVAPNFAGRLDGLAISVKGAPVVSIPIAVCLFSMMYPIMVKIDFAEVVKAGKSIKPVALTLFINWAIKPFTMFAIAFLFFGVIFKGYIGAEATDIVNLPVGATARAGEEYGAGTVILDADGVRMLEVPLWRSYLWGAILLGVAPCTAMVLVWGYLARGNDGHTLVMVAINSLTMLFLYGPLGGLLLGIGRLPVPWQALVLSISIYVALPLAAGYISRKLIIAHKGEQWFREKFLHINPGQPVDNSVDCDSAVHPDGVHLRRRLRPEQGPQAPLWRRRPHGDDRRIQPLRGCNSHRDNAVRPVVRRSTCNSGRRADRSARHAHVSQNLPENTTSLRLRSRLGQLLFGRYRIPRLP